MPTTPSTGVRKLFEDPNLGHIATLMADGSPQVTPVWVDLAGDRIRINSADGRTKVKNVRRDPRVAISIAAPGGYPSAYVRGHVVELTHEGADEHIDALAKKYMGRVRYPLHRPDQQRVTIVIEPDHASSMMAD